MEPDADHILYTMALCCGLAGDGNGACENLKRAIDLEPRNRILARQDPEFSALASQLPGLRALLWIPDRIRCERQSCPGASASRTRFAAMNEALRVVSIGGGHGLSALLNGLKKYSHSVIRTDEPRVDITAIVTVTDDGGSSGRLRREFDVLPPGDIRNCMVALSEDGALLSQLFQYRFEAGRGLKGPQLRQSVSDRADGYHGRFPGRRAQIRRSVEYRGRIFPSTAANVSLEAVLDDGKVVSGETRISRSRRRIRQIRLQPNRVRPLQETLDAIARADLITLGPGSLFTSVIPNLLVSGIPQAIRAVARAEGLLRESDVAARRNHRTSAASDHVPRHARTRRRQKLLDCAVVSTSRISPALRRRYAEQNAAPVENRHRGHRGTGISK